MRPCVFLDRDGTINEDTGYLYEPDKLILIPGVEGAIKRLNDMGWAVVCISNQSGVARGYFSIEDVHTVNAKLEELLALGNAYIDMIYFCPHHPTKGFPPFSQDCKCRKPGTAMLEKAVLELDIDLTLSYFIGDSLSDIQTAHAMGLKSILVLTGFGVDTLKMIRSVNKNIPDHICKDLPAAVDWILGQKKRF